MSSKTYPIIFLLLTITGCNSRDATPAVNTTAPAASSPAPTMSPGMPPSTTSTTAVKANVDICNLLTSDDVKGVQGAAYKEALRSDRLDGDFIVAQCYYQLPTMSNSVVLNVTTAKEGAGAQNPRTLWEGTFARRSEKGRDRDKDKSNTGAKDRESEEEEAPVPRKVTGLGDDAYWIASRVGGALYVLKKDQFFRISVGGAGDEKTKLNKSKTLAQRVLKKI